MSKLTLTAKIKIHPNEEEKRLLLDTVHAIRKGLNFTSDVVFKTNELVQTKLHKRTYYPLRSQYGLKSQMAQSVMKTVISKYKSMASNGVKKQKPFLKNPNMIWFGIEITRL